MIDHSVSWLIVMFQLRLILFFLSQGWTIKLANFADFLSDQLIQYDHLARACSDDQICSFEPLINLSLINFYELIRPSPEQLWKQQKMQFH